MHSSSSSSSFLAPQASQPQRPRSDSCSSVDEDEINSRVTPDWYRYQRLIESHGYRLDTFRDVRAFYQHYLESQISYGSSVQQSFVRQPWRGYPCNGEAEEDLCKDRGLPDNLFRGTRLRDGKKLMIKAVGMRSHELDVIHYLSSPQLRRDPANHTIPVLDIIQVPRDDVAFIVQEDWPSSFAHSAPSSLRGVLQALRQCIEGLAFMHAHNVAHLDVSLTNILTNCSGTYAYIDFELSRRFHAEKTPVVRCIRGTELPPEVERGEDSCPFKVDIWALGVLILRACKAAGFDIVELLVLTRPMLRERPQDRPSAKALLQEFDRIFTPHESRVLRRKGAPIN